MNPTRERIVRNTLFLVVPAGLFLGLAALNLLSALWDSQYQLGFRISPQDWDLVVAEVTPGSPAEHGGLRRGDLLRSIDGHAVSGLASYRSLERGFLRAESIRFSLRRGERDVEVRLRSPNLGHPASQIRDRCHVPGDRLLYGRAWFTDC